MTLTPKEQVKLYVDGHVYAYAVRAGLIEQGDPLRYSSVLTATKEEATNALDEIGYPGLDYQVNRFENSREGFGWRCENGKYEIYFCERGTETLISESLNEYEFGLKWKKLYLDTMLSCFIADGPSHED